MIQFQNTQALPDEVQKIFLPFLNKFLQATASDIISVFVYGSATGENFIPKSSDINFAVVTNEINLTFLQKSLQAMGFLRNKRIHAPLILTQAHILSSLDVFPIEFLEMKDNYVVVYGEDPLKDVVVQDTHVRLFCEQQIKGKLIRIHQAYIEDGNRASAVEALMKESLNTLIPVFRCLLRVKGIPVPLDKGDVLHKISEAFGVETSAMVSIWKDKKNDERILGRDVHEVFGQYIQELDRLAHVVDQL